MKIILIVFPKINKATIHYMPFTSLAIASKLESEGHKVIIYDQRVDNRSKFLEFIEIVDEVWLTVFSGFQLINAYDLTVMAKLMNKNVKTIWGGPSVEVLNNIFIKDKYIDECKTGYYEEGENIINWNLVNIKKYINPETKRFMYLTSYGCPGVCTFCATEKKRKYIEINIKKITKDIENLMNLYKFKECVLFDATLFKSKENRILEISKIMNNYNIKWIADARAIELLQHNERLLETLNMQGLKQITIGLETGSQKVANIMKKGKNHIEIYKKISYKMAKTNIKQVSGLIFGTPGEGIEDIKETINYVRNIKKINPNFFVSTTFFMPLPGTMLYRRLVEKGYIKEHKTLQEWYDKSKETDFKYNVYMTNKWIKDKKEYKKIYDDFIENNKELLI